MERNGEKVTEMERDTERGSDRIIQLAKESNTETGTERNRESWTLLVFCSLIFFILNCNWGTLLPF